MIRYGYGISVPKRDQTANERVADNFSGFLNLTIIHCDGKDVFDSMSAMDEARKIAIEKCEPVIVHADCVRIGNHSNSDKHEWYRDDKEIADAKAQDPYPRFRKELLEAKAFSEKELNAIDEEMKKVVLDAHVKAMKAPNPSPESIFDFVSPVPFVSTKYPTGVHTDTSEPVKFIDAINGTLKAEFRHNPNTFIWGQDMANKEKGGIFKQGFGHISPTLKGCTSLFGN